MKSWLKQSLRKIENFLDDSVTSSYVIDEGVKDLSSEHNQIGQPDAKPISPPSNENNATSDSEAKDSDNDESSGLLKGNPRPKTRTESQSKHS